ncbi:hypothetical protein SAMN05216559_4208 [Halomicrobium zhouii]|uniref:Uncharacterized protein n=1 Tax=Halomicrobium zhouii TaxID=767519 RepID=A0A1I6MBS1_9EURY|nr:hypothetical protein [Halomicrobium zhouii]SFS13144.1 hypothetical protein SAMN05216559_4208 [Halomicrobium zhouii]
MADQDLDGETVWEVHLAGPGLLLQRVACSLNAVSTGAWLLLFVLPPLLGGVWIAVGDAPPVGQIAYAVLCLCLWLALATIGASFQHVRYELDASGAVLLVEREGYDPTIDRSTSEDSPAVPLGAVQSVTAASFPGYQVLRMRYGGNEDSGLNTIIVPTSRRSVWDALQQRQQTLPSLPSAPTRDLWGYVRLTITVLVAGVLPLGLLSEEVLPDVILISVFVVVAGLVQNTLATVRRGDARDLSAYGGLFVGALKTLSVVVSVILLGVLVNRLI